jgi:adenylate kinase
VGVGIILQDPLTDKIVVGIRAGSHGSGTWHWPGGHLEMGETPQETAARELLEETGICIAPANVRVLGFTNDLHRAEGKHYITITCYAEWDGLAQPRTMEASKCLGWHWKNWEEVRGLQPLFLPAANFMAQPSFSPPEGIRLARIRRHMRGRFVFLNGYPGSGKGTQGQVLAAQLGLRHVSTGELFRKEAASGSEIGRQMGELMQKGEILPPEMTFDYLRKELSREEYKCGVLLDGYPKDLHCLAFILDFVGPERQAAAIFFDISREEVQERLLGRLACSKCERNYHRSLTGALPAVPGKCDACGSALAPRADDTEATIIHRLDSFEAKTKPVTARFKELGLLESIDARLSPYRVNAQVLEAMERRVCSSGVGSWWASGGSAQGQAPAVELSSKWHNHMDACDDATLLKLVTEVSAKVKSAQQKVYPISYLFLGPQCNAREFGECVCVCVCVCVAQECASGSLLRGPSSSFCLPFLSPLSPSLFLSLALSLTLPLPLPFPLPLSPSPSLLLARSLSRTSRQCLPASSQFSPHLRHP